MDKRLIFLILLVLNSLFWIAYYHMCLNFFAQKMGQKITAGVFHIKTDDAYRYSSYATAAIYLLTDMLFIWAFLS